MGLSAHIFQNVYLSNKDEHDFKAFVGCEDWKYKIKNLEEGKFYRGKHVRTGINYAYSTHSRFREALIKLIDREDLLLKDDTIDWENLPSDIPFYDFIWFSDAEGCIDWETNEKIYKDFLTYETKAIEFMDRYYSQVYREWLKVFAIAKDKGVVVFR